MNSNSDLLDASDPATSSTSTSRRSTSTVRPRNRRPISFNEEEDDDGAQSLSSRLSAAFTSGLTPSQSRDTTPSPFASRRSSPLPSKHPSRTTEIDRQRSDDAGGNGLKSSSTSQGAGSTFATGFLESSWSSLQSLASSVLGSDPTRAKSSSGSATSHKRRKPSRSNFYMSSAPKQSQPSSWGPPAPAATQIGAGTKEERQALVQAKKREVLLLANGDSVSDLKGRYKRRGSAGTSDPTAVDTEHDEEALVYVHHVQPTDSMTGVTIKYGCQLAVMRKANGFWPSDSIQSRKTVLLPVEACSVKGRRVRPEQDQDLLGDGADETNRNASTAEDNSHDDDRSAKNNNDRTWKHEAWVEIEGFPAAVEIGRVPRRTLGFFPRTRRKSQSQSRPYTDAESPSSSFDISRPSERPDSSFTQPSSSSNPSAGTESADAGSRRGHRRNKSSICLVGPGGVGTLGQDVTAPGPAPDGLNKFFAQHLPQLTAAPAPVAPRKTSFDSTVSTTSSTTGLENVGGAIEGWVRKMASRAKAGLAELQQSSQGQPGQAVGIGGLGDLIELDDGLEGTTPIASTGSRSRYHHAGTGTSQFRPSPSVSATSRARATGFGAGSNLSADGESERLKGD
ncbi:hypothetical protein VTN77DRAFT_656 [Rasamsonia byssochlamydoides]|uniref:uncharacterized protein n=1 Tax=Rasamsonia byssochlamydoides TaxID=89139 RepID=UPI0037426C9D